VLALVNGIAIIFPLQFLGWMASMGFSCSLARVRIQKVIDKVDRAAR